MSTIYRLAGSEDVCCKKFMMHDFTSFNFETSDMHGIRDNVRCTLRYLFFKESNLYDGSDLNSNKISLINV